MEITIDGEKFEYRTDYQDDKAMRESFDGLAQRVFGISLEKWYLGGFWSDRYRPHSLFLGERVVASVSVNPMDLTILGDPVRCVQLGGVMTDAEFRGRGLQHFLMNRVIEDWKDKCDAMYLFANAAALDIVPKFGFVPAREYQHSIRLDAPRGRGTRRADRARGVRRLDPSRAADQALLMDRYARSNPLSLCAFEHSPGLLMYHCLDALKECLYYVGEYRAVAIAAADGGTLYLHDVFCPDGASLTGITAALAGPETRRAVLGFTPKDGSAYSVRPLRDKDAALFFLSGKKDLFGARQLRLPILSRV